LLRGYLIHGLDLLNQSEFEQIRARLGPDYSALSSAVIDQRIRETTEYASVLFYIDIHSRDTGTIFYSSNLKGRPIPDIKGARSRRRDFRSGAAVERDVRSARSLLQERAALCGRCLPRAQNAAVARSIARREAPGRRHLESRERGGNADAARGADARQQHDRRAAVPLARRIAQHHARAGAARSGRAPRQLQRRCAGTRRAPRRALLLLARRRGA